RRLEEGVEAAGGDPAEEVAAELGHVEELLAGREPAGEALERLALVGRAPDEEAALEVEPARAARREGAVGHDLRLDLGERDARGAAGSRPSSSSSKLRNPNASSLPAPSFPERRSKRTRPADE